MNSCFMQQKIDHLLPWHFAGPEMLIPFRKVVIETDEISPSQFFCKHFYALSMIKIRSDHTILPVLAQYFRIAGGNACYDLSEGQVRA